MEKAELAAAYERIDELKATLTDVRDAIIDSIDPHCFVEDIDVVERIDRALDERVAA